MEFKQHEETELRMLAATASYNAFGIPPSSQGEEEPVAAAILVAIPFLPLGEEGTLDALKCLVCNCHRNFHRKETPNDTYLVPYYHHSPLPLAAYYGEQVGYPHVQGQQCTTLALPSRSRGSGGAQSSREDMEAVSDPTSGATPHGGSSKKRFRTRFTQEQKGKMLAFAEKLGWRIMKHDESVVQEFCAQTNIQPRVLKVWVHNNKHTLNKVFDGDAQVSFPTSKIQYVRQAHDIFLAWPANLGKCVSHEDSRLTPSKVFEPIERLNNVATDDPLRQLIRTLYDIYEKPVELLWDGTKFGIPNVDASFFLTYSYVNEIISGEKCLNIAILQLWMMFMDEWSSSLGHGSVYGFLEPQSIHNAKERHAECQQYIETWVKESQ
ncbi:ZF-HD homeobox protein [Glycine soja]|uniref:ZF-HD homeobox protein n=1 Tax=Glycine soja TaxID=3848 RepID=A0A0B2QIW0_GLYSO|nr:ZF-HD homeobox protein [Glycine soja]